MRRALPVLALVCFFVGALVWLGIDKKIPQERFEAYSVYNSSSQGLSRAHKYLRAKSSSRVSILSRPIERAFLEPDAVVFRIQAMGVHPAPLLNPEEDQWVQRGGRLVIAFEGEAMASASSVIRRVFPVTWGGERLEPVRSVLSGPPLEDAHTLLATDSGAVMARRVKGKGDVLLLSCPAIFLNDHIAKGDNLSLLVDLAGEGRPVYFDEFIHGLETDAGILEILRHWGLGPLVLMITLAAGIGWWRARVRLGPAEGRVDEERVEAIDFVDSLALLYDRALKRQQALALYHDAFVRAVHFSTGLKSEPLKTKVQSLLGRSVRIPSAKERQMGNLEFQRELRLLNEGFRRLMNEKHQRGRRKIQVGQRRVG